MTVAEVLAQRETGAATATEARARYEAWAAAFVCGDRTGLAAPCGGAENLTVPSPWKPGARVYCPIAETVRCEPWLAIKRRDYRRERDAWLERCRRRGIPKRFVNFTLDDVDDTPAVLAVRAYLDGGAREGRALGLLGPVGVGKTVAASVAVSAWSPGSALFIEADRIAQAAARDHEKLTELVTRAEDAALLALDDLFRGHVKVGGLAEHIVEEIICRRHAEERATILSSNLTPTQLAARLSPRVVDRLREWATVVALEGPSLRRPETEDEE